MSSRRLASLELCPASCNNRGVCYKSGNFFYCRCLSDAFGVACEYLNSTTSPSVPASDDDESIVLCIVVLGGCGLLVSCACLWYALKDTEFVGKSTKTVCNLVNTWFNRFIRQ
ncbi:hypothetical protein CAEBREN_07968 [Caenorhabditis brenneri]|uniref:EGF-like domain-containing protein n=1 Tax=Caenorhabditis brenneri TaxID=135651 RepID=G0NSU8_CAEBE|nr:hypothetical protein CAEBREN_07968 [Caenorhabditis brenneri]